MYRNEILCRALLFFAAIFFCGAAEEAAPAAAKVSEDLRRAGLENRDVIHYAVEPMSNLKRTRFSYPEDGKLNAPLRIVAAQDEYEPASFVLYSFRDAEKVDLIPGPLTGKNGTLPASAIDMKVVKLWYQTGNAWYSYFANATEKQLIPELLLKDESLVETDFEKKENYLRVKEESGQERRLWISAPAGTYEPLDTNRTLVADSDTLLPFRLRKNEFKQIWLTFHAPAGAEGVYKGAVRVRIEGRDAASIPLEVRVLPFRLPPPKTHYNPDAPFFAGSYNSVNLAVYVRENGGDAAKAEKRVRAEYDSFRRHNLMYPILPPRNVHTKPEDYPHIRRQLELYKQCGLGTEALFNAVTGFPSYADLNLIDKQGSGVRMKDHTLSEKWKQIVCEDHAFAQNLFGKDILIYCFGWDEPGMRILRAERPYWNFLHERGLKVFSTGSKAHLLHGGFNEDFVNYGGRITREDTLAWHTAGSKIASYADPHTGIENPDFVRRTHGMSPWLVNSDGSMNYKVCGSDWNDFVGTKYNFRAFNMIYPGTFAPVETIQYEAYREAIDDVKYATLLKQCAASALKSEKPEQVYKARAALLFLAQLDPETCDLNTVRTEMIRHILELMDLK